MEKMKAADKVPLFAPQVTLSGDRAVFVEGYKGILEYTESTISVDCGKTVLEIAGDKMTIKSFSRECFRAEGRIFSVVFRV